MRSKVLGREGGGNESLVIAIHLARYGRIAGHQEGSMSVCSG